MRLPWEESYSLALECFDRVIRQRSDIAWAWYHRARVLCFSDRTEEAIDAYQEALNRKPKDGFLWYMKGRTLEDLNWYEAAHESYKMASRFVKPKSFLAYFCLGKALEHEKFYDNAIENYRKLVEVSPWSEEPLKLLCQILNRQERYEEAINIFETIVKKNSYNHLAQEKLREFGDKQTEKLERLKQEERIKMETKQTKATQEEAKEIQQKRRWFPW